MITWTLKYFGNKKVVVGMKGTELLFDISEDATGYQRVQGHGKFSAYATRHLDLASAKNAAIERITWGKK